jgi:hypothetical protein
MATTTFPLTGRVRTAAEREGQASALAQFFRGVLLIAYIGVLGWAALFALQNGFSRRLLDPPAETDAVRQALHASSWCETPGTIFTRWVGLTQHQPADGQVIDAIWPGWRAKVPDGRCTDAAVWQEWWISEFAAMDDVLSALIADPEFDPRTGTLTKDALPSDFSARAAPSFTGKLPLPVQSWVLRQRMQRTLLDLFVLLSVIGTFGSLIYLLVQFIAGHPTTMAEFLFRPTLGAFLAVAIFVADIGILGMTSSAGVFEVRAPTLYLFALGAGLSSDVIYAYLLARVAAAASDGASAPRAERAD